MSDEVAIGIDLGTSNSCVAVADGRQVEVLCNSYGEPITASVVSFRENGSIVVGNAAKASLIHDPPHTVASAKRLIGRYSFSDEVKKAQRYCSYRIVEGEGHSVRIRIRDEEFSIPEISAMVLREMKAIAEARLGHEVHKAVITVPAYFNDNQRQATKDAGRIAGLEVMRLLNEPTAAALAFGFGHGLNQRVAVYDLGGGTFDVSILEIGSDVFEVLATYGDTYLGGDDFDDRIIGLLADEFAAKESIDLRADPYAFEKLKVAAEAAKRGLSVDDAVEINIPEITLGPDQKPRSIQRTLSCAEFSSLVMDLIQRTFKVCDEALQHAGVIARDLDGVIMVGGPTRLPVIRKAVGEYFQQEPRAGVDPDQVVAMGAAIHATTLVSSTPQEAYLLDVTPLSLRIGVAGGLAETVIERNTPVPIEQSRNFTTVQDYQESVKIMVFQGESRQASENELLGQFEFSGFEKRRRGEVPIEVTFEIDGDGLVNVTARDSDTGHQASTQITLSSGLSEDEIARIVDEGRTQRVEVDPGAPLPQAVADEMPTISEVQEQDLPLPAREIPVAPELPAAAEELPVVSEESTPSRQDVELGADEAVELLDELIPPETPPTPEDRPRSPGPAPAEEPVIEAVDPLDLDAIVAEATSPEVELEIEFEPEVHEPPTHREDPNAETQPNLDPGAVVSLSPDDLEATAPPSSPAEADTDIRALFDHASTDLSAEDSEGEEA